MMTFTYLLILSLTFSSYKGHQGDDMTDDDFIRYVEAHPEYLEKATVFMVENRDVIVRGLVGSGVGVALKSVVQSNPIIGSLIIGGATELAKEVYKKTTGDSKEDRLEKMEAQLESFTNEIATLKAEIAAMRPALEKEDAEAIERFNTAQIESEKRGESYERIIKSDGDGNDVERRRPKQGHGNHDYRSDPKDCGPHRDNYREHKSETEQNRETRETIESTYKDPMNDRNYVEKR